MQLKSIKGEVFRVLRRFDLQAKYRNLQNFVKNVEVDKSEIQFSGKRCLVISPHPDDESIACGGTVKILTQKQNVVDVVYLTEGEYGVGPGVEWTEALGADLKKIRKSEAASACEILGVNQFSFLSGKDTQLHHQHNLAKPLAELIERGNYACVLCPWPYDAHSDHAAAFDIFREAVATLARPIEIWLYEVWNPLLANRLVNIDQTMETKLEAIRSHQSQKVISDFSQKFTALAQYRSVSVQNCRYAEAYFVCDKTFIQHLK
jgi:LmbE family N-acetylglucosaminyl deacetylase